MERWRREYGQYYVFPGGGVEAGERPADTVRRELREETGLRAKIVREVFHGLTPRGNRHTYFLAEAPKLPVALPRRAEENSPERIAKRGTVKPVWVPLARIRGLRLMPPSIRPFLLRALQIGFPKRPVELGKLWSGARSGSKKAKRATGSVARRSSLR